MRLTAPLLTLLLLAPLATFAQETEPPDGARIAAAQVSGFELARLSPGLQDEINKLAGAPLSRQQLRELASRIEGEQPRYITAVRLTQDPDGSARVTFVVARIRDQGRDPDINTKYIVDEVDVQGVPDRDLTPDLRSDLLALEGKPLDTEAAERLGERLRMAFPRYDVDRRTVRANQQGHINIIYSLRLSESGRWLRFEPIDANAIFHSDQGWGAFLPLGFGGRDVHVSAIVAWDNADDLVEEYSGFGLRVDSRRLGTDRLGMFFEWSTYDQDWRDRTLAALSFNPQIPGPYRNRMTVTPLLKFAFTPQLSVAGGVGITELDPFIEIDALPSQMANAAIGSVRFLQEWHPAERVEHHAGAALTLRAGTRSLSSDFTYNRYLAEGEYSFRQRGHRVRLTAMGGHIDGAAPLFERFSLGDSRTLRGWDKYDIAPAGGNRMFHTSLEYRYHAVMLFVDAGSVWDAGREKIVRFATGAGFTPGPAFFILGFPLNTDEFRAVFTMGFRFGRSTVGVTKY